MNSSRVRAQSGARWTAWAVAWTLAVAASPVHAMPTDAEAKAHLERGNAAFAKGDFDTAVDEYRKGYAKQDDPAFLYTWAQAERKRGRCSAAVKLYKRYMATNPPELSADAARDGIVSCAEALAADDPLPPVDDNTPTDDPADPPPVATEPEDPPPDTTPEKPRRERKPKAWNRDPAAISLMVVGGVAIAGGVGLLAGSWSWVNNAPNYGAYDERIGKLRGLQIGGGVLLGVGVGALVGGVARMMVLRKRERSNTSVAATFDRSGGGLALTHCF